MKSGPEKRLWRICAVLSLIVCAVLLGMFLRRRTKKGEDSIESVKIEVDAATRATPARLAGPLEITNISTYEALNFDRAVQDHGTLSYELSKPAWIRIRLVARRDRNLVLRTLVDWSKRNLGENTERWDGLDSSGNPVDREKCPCYFVIEGDNAEHAAHERSRCGDMTLHFTEPGLGPVVTGTVPVGVALTGRKTGYIAQEGGVMRTYVDYEPTHEEPLGAGGISFEWQWNTTKAPDGSHVVTVSIDDGHDHIASASATVAVDN